VSEFKYLGSLVSEDGYCEKELHSRIALGKKIFMDKNRAKMIFMDKKRLFTGKLNLELKKQIIKCLVWSVELYAVETWTLMQTNRSKLDAFEMWIWRSMDKISWVNKKTSEEILNMLHVSVCVW